MMSGNFSLMDIAVQFKKATKHCPCKIKNHPSLMGGFLLEANKWGYINTLEKSGRDQKKT